MNFHVAAGVRLGRDGAGRILANIQCRRCESTAVIPIKSAMQSRADAFMAKKLRSAGWTPGHDRTTDLCPSCASTPKSPRKETQQPTFQFIDLDKALDMELTMQTTTPEKEAKKRTRVNLTRVEEHQISRLLQQHVTVLKDGMCRYENEMTDLKIAVQCGVERATVGHVSAIRADLFGRINAKRANSPADRLTALEARVEELERLFLTR